MNAIHINSMLDQKAVGAPVITSSSSTNNCNLYASGFFRRNSTSNMESMTNGNKFPASSYSISSMKENAIMNKENKFREPRLQRERPAAAAAGRSRAHRSTPPATRRSSAGPSRKTALAVRARSASLRTATTSWETCLATPKYKTEPCRTFQHHWLLPIRSAVPLHPQRRRAQTGAEQRQQRAGEFTKPARCEPVKRLRAAAATETPPQPQLLLVSPATTTTMDSTHPLLESPTSRTPPPSSGSSCAASFYEGARCLGNSASLSPAKTLKALLAPLAVNTQQRLLRNPSGQHERRSRPLAVPPAPVRVAGVRLAPPARLTASLTGRATPAARSAPLEVSVALSLPVWTAEGVCQSSAGCRFPMINPFFVVSSGLYSGGVSR